MWDGSDGMGFDNVGDAMRRVAMQYDATPCHAMPWDWMEFDGMGSDAMRRNAMGLDFFNDGWGGSVMAGCSSAFNVGAVFRCSLVGLRRWRGDPLLARRL